MELFHRRHFLVHLAVDDEHGNVELASVYVPARGLSLPLLPTSLSPLGVESEHGEACGTAQDSIRLWGKKE